MNNQTVVGTIYGGFNDDKSLLCYEINYPHTYSYKYYAATNDQRSGCVDSSFGVQSDDNLMVTCMNI